MSPDGRVVRVGVLGCGNVGGALVELIDTDSSGIAKRSGTRLEVTRVAVRNLAKPRSVHLGADRLTHDAQHVATDPDVDIVVELIGGLEPARTFIIDALKHGKPVVTANKELLANFGVELFGVAEEAGSELLFEGSVAGAIPLLRSVHVSLVGERIRRIVGIVNGTTNYILSADERGGDRLRRGAQRGAEARLRRARSRPQTSRALTPPPRQPSSPGIAFNAEVVAGDVYREGIDTIDVSRHRVRAPARLRGEAARHHREHRRRQRKRRHSSMCASTRR